MRLFLAISALLIITFCFSSTDGNEFCNISFKNQSISVKTGIDDSTQKTINGDFKVYNFRTKNRDTFFYFYAGPSSSCLNNPPSFIIPDTTCDYISISEVNWFQYRYNEDSIATLDAVRDNRKYYSLAWFCQKGKFHFYMENDTLFKLNPFRSSQNLLNYGGENLNELPRWLPYSIIWLSPNKFKIGDAYPSFYPVFNKDDSNDIQTIFSRKQECW